MLCSSHPNQAPFCAKLHTAILLSHVNTGRSFRAFKLHSNSPQELCPSTFELLVLCSVGIGVSQCLENRTNVPHRAQGALFVFPSFTYLTAAVLSFVVFPFILFSSASTPAEQWVIVIISFTDPLINMPMLTLNGLIVM